MIAENGQDMFVDEESIKKLAWEVMCYVLDQYRQGIFYEATQKFIHLSYCHPLPNGKRMVDWIFVFNTLNFSLWNPKDTNQWTIKGLAGFQGSCTAIN